MLWNISAEIKLQLAFCIHNLYINVSICGIYAPSYAITLWLRYIKIGHIFIICGEFVRNGNSLVFHYYNWQPNRIITFEMIYLLLSYGELDTFAIIALHEENATVTRVTVTTSLARITSKPRKEMRIAYTLTSS